MPCLPSSNIRRNSQANLQIEKQHWHSSTALHPACYALALHKITILLAIRQLHSSKNGFKNHYKIRNFI